MRNQKGMTLVEILVAMGLMVMVAFCFTPFMLSSLQNVQVAGQQRETLYEQKGDIEEQIAEGIDYTAPDDSFTGVLVNFKQGAVTEQSSAEGIFLTSVGEMLTSFIARDEASLTLSPGSVVENSPNTVTIEITCDFVAFTDASKFSLVESDGTTGTAVPWVTFSIDASNDHRAVMRAAVGGYRFDMSKTYLVCYDTLKAPLTVTPSSLVAVGSNGAYYVYTADKVWKKGSGTNSSSSTGRLGDQKLNDIVWTGTQYLAVGEKGSWYYTQDGAGWQYDNIGSEATLNHLSNNEATVYVSGTVEKGWLLKYQAPYQIRLTDLSSPRLGKDVDSESETWFGYGEAGTIAWFNNIQKDMWGTYSTWYNNVRVGNVDLFDRGNHLGDMDFNGYTSIGVETRPEVLAVSNTYGKIYNTLDGVTWNNNGDRKQDASAVINPDKPAAYIHTYYYKDDNAESGWSELSFSLPADNIENAQPLAIVAEADGTYSITYNNQKYILREDAESTVTLETYYKNSVITIGNVLNSAAFGSTETGDRWVVGGNAAFEETDTYTKNMEKKAYKINATGAAPLWEKTSDQSLTAEPDNPGTGTVEDQNVKILWREGDNYQDGIWHIAEVPSECTTINDIEFIGGKFYAVGDDGWIMYSLDGKTWTEMDVDPSLTEDLYGIAGWGDDWGTD